MVDLFDPAMAAIAVATIGIILWLVTQIHLLRVARRIEANIDAKRTETQDFVDVRIERLEKAVGGFEARMTAQMPPNVHGDIEALRARLPENLEERLSGIESHLETRFHELDRGITTALKDIEIAFRGVTGTIGAGEAELRRHLVGVEEEATSALQEAADSEDMTNPVVRRLYAWAARPVDPKIEAKNPIGAAALQIGKAALLERLQSGSIGGATRSFLRKTTSGFKPGFTG